MIICDVLRPVCNYRSEVCKLVLFRKNNLIFVKLKNEEEEIVVLFSTCVEYFRLVLAAKPNSKSVSLKFSLFDMCLENHHHQLVVEKALENKTHTCYFRCGKCRHTILNQLPGRHTPVIHSPPNKNHTHIRFHTLSSQTDFHIYSDIVSPLSQNPKERGRTGWTIHIYTNLHTVLTLTYPTITQI